MFIRPMTLQDHSQLIQLFQETPGFALREADSQEALSRYLYRNPDLFCDRGHSTKNIGCVMCGHDGRRGYLQHLVVRPEYRGN